MIMRNPKRENEINMNNSDNKLERYEKVVLQNLKEDFEKHQKEAKRIFTSILRAANSHWGEISYDPDKKIATGVMPTSGGRVYTAELSYDDIKNRLSLVIRIHLKRDLPDDHSQQILKYQYHKYGLVSFLTVDLETPLASIRAFAAVPQTEPKCAVTSIFLDTYTLLEDDELNQLINSTT